MKILLIGPQGSGKSTQAKLLAEYLNIPHISTGDTFRRLTQKNIGIGQIIKGILEQGKLVDNQTTSSIVRERLQEDDCKEGFIMDGYPRNLAQKDLFDPGVDQVFYLKVPEEEVTKRMMARGRTDDSLEAIRSRLKLYYEQTKPLLDYYRSHDMLIEISGIGTVEKIQDEIREHIEKS